MEPKIICLTPVRNESWILDTFLKSTSLWADHIIIVDQNSTDNSREIIKRYSKATLVEYSCTDHSQFERRKMLIDKAREVTGGEKSLLLAIDADEILSPESLSPTTWKQILECEPGTVFRFQWATLLPDKGKYWTGYFLPYGYMDDGYEYDQTQPHHGTRLPAPEGNPVYDVTEFKVIHFQYMNPGRNLSRQRWYQCLEVDDRSIANDAIDIFRKYHYEQAMTEDRISDIPTTWTEQLLPLDIDINKTFHENQYWYDLEVKKLFDKYGYKHFKKLDIWHDVFKEYDPRGVVDKAVHLWLRKSQPHYYSKARKIDNVIRRVFNY